MKNITSKKIGSITGKVFAGAKSLPNKTASTSKSLKDEFLAGFAETSGSTKEKGDQPPVQNAEETQQ